MRAVVEHSNLEQLEQRGEIVAQDEPQRQRGRKVDRSFRERVELVFRVSHRIRHESEITASHRVVGISAENVLHLVRSSLFRIVRDESRELVRAVGDQVKHGLQFAGGEAGAEYSSHFPPSVAAKEEQAIARQRVHLLVHDAHVIGEIVEIFHGNGGDQLRVPDHYHRCHEVIHTEVLDVWETMVQVFEALVHGNFTEQCRRHVSYDRNRCLVRDVELFETSHGLP